MNPDQNQNNYFKLNEGSEPTLDHFRDEKIQAEHDIVHKMPPTLNKYFGQKYGAHNDHLRGPQSQDLNVNLNPQNTQVHGVPTHNKPLGQDAFIQNQPHIQPVPPVIIYNNVAQTQRNLQASKRNNKTTVIVQGANQMESILYGQSLPCQRCGLASNGYISLHWGRTVAAWSSCLFITTGLFCFLPCVMDRCKDTWINCPRCGHKKVVVKSNCCC